MTLIEKKCGRIISINEGAVVAVIVW